MVRFHSFYLLFRHEHVPAGLIVVHSGSAYMRMLVHLRLLLLLKSQKENSDDDENPDDAETIKILRAATKSGH